MGVLTPFNAVGHVVLRSDSRTLPLGDAPAEVAQDARRQQADGIKRNVRAAKRNANGEICQGKHPDQSSHDHARQRQCLRHVARPPPRLSKVALLHDHAVHGRQTPRTGQRRRGSPPGPLTIPSAVPYNTFPPRVVHAEFRVQAGSTFCADSRAVCNPDKRSCPQNR